MTDPARYSDLHIHTDLCDGGDTPEAMAERAQLLGLRTLGFSGHSPTDFGCEWALRDLDGYVGRINSLRGRVRELNILCGLEYDSGWTLVGRERFDYIIGSVHYIPTPDGRRVPIDESREITAECIERDFGGSSDRFAEAYFEELASMVARVRPDIVGHLDLIEKFNVDGGKFSLFRTLFNRSASITVFKGGKKGANFHSIPPKRAGTTVRQNSAMCKLRQGAG